MASIGPVLGTSATTDGGAGTAWSNPSNVLTDNASNATVTLSAGVNSEFLRIVGFGSSLTAIPDTATIVGIGVFLNATSTTGNMNYLVQLTKDGTSRESGFASGSDADADFTVGGASELWDTTWTVAEIEASTFGVHVRGTGGNPGGGTFAIDYVSVTVYYTEVGGGAPKMIRRFMQRRAA